MERTRLRKLISFLAPKLMTIQYEGLEYLPKEGPVLVTTNHLSRMDIPVLFLNPVRLDMTALVTDKYKSNLFISWFVKSTEAIWIDRTRADFAAFQAAFEVFKQGRALGISPEGTRSKTGQLLEGKSGSILLATKMDVPIVPVGLAGTETVVSSWKKLRKLNVVARFGPAYKLPQIDRNNREEHTKELTDEIMCRIAACLPEKYHGYYRGYPRIREILEKQKKQLP